MPTASPSTPNPCDPRTSAAAQRRAALRVESGAPAVPPPAARDYPADISAGCDLDEAPLRTAYPPRTSSRARLDGGLRRAMDRVLEAPARQRVAR